MLTRFNVQSIERKGGKENQITRSCTISSVLADYTENCDAGSLVEVLERFCLRFGFAHATYYCLDRFDSQSLGADLITTYPDEWIKHYAINRYKDIDPVLSYGSSALLPLNWSDIPKRDPQIIKFFGEASDFGISEHGLSITIRDSKGRTALFSINSERDIIDNVNRCNHIKSDIFYTAFLLHELILSQRDQKIEETSLSLSPRQIEVMRWAALGKTAWETAQITGLAEKTVSFYISKACEKLNVVNKSQGVAKVLHERLITL